MRHLVYFLLVANLAYFGWNLFSSGTAGETARELPPLPATAKPLVTLQELKQQSATAPEQEMSGIDTLTLSQPPGAGMPAACQVLGPFYAEEALHAVAGKLGLEPRQRIAEDRKESGYWIYLPAMERGEALQIAKMLDERNDHEYYIGKDNFMSLGTFKDISRAEIRLSQVRQLGLNAILETRYITLDAYWLEFQGRAAAAPVLDDVLEENPDLQLRACLPVTG
ncbi:MAG: hypothetical protein WBQ78_05100 [Gammaproteobacteria bacterium]